MLHDHYCNECKASYLCPITGHCTKPAEALCPDHAYVDPRKKYDKDLRGKETEEPSAYEPSDPKHPRWWK